MGSWQSLLRRAVKLGGRHLLEQLQPRPPRQSQPSTPTPVAAEKSRPQRAAATPRPAPEFGPGTRYPNAVLRPAGNRTHVFQALEARAQFDYAPRPDGAADPGEVVWTWVPYAEDDRIGKDRPVLVVGKVHAEAAGEASLLCAQMTSKDHQLDAAQEAASGRFWCAIGTGPWDRQLRPSAVRVDRLLRVAAKDVRREGATLAPARFQEVLRAIERHWQ